MMKDTNIQPILFEENDSSTDRLPNTFKEDILHIKSLKNNNSILSNIKSRFFKKSTNEAKENNKAEFPQVNKTTENEKSKEIEKNLKNNNSILSKITSYFSKKSINKDKENNKTIQQVNREIDSENSPEIKKNSLLFNPFTKYPKLNHGYNSIVSNITKQLYKDYNGFRLIDGINTIKKHLNLIDIEIDTIDFKITPTGVPMPGTQMQKLNIIYEIKSPFQYAKVLYENDKVSYHSIEPVLSESEIKCLDTIKDAFSKMIRSETLLAECQDQEKKTRYLNKRFLNIIDIYKFKMTDIQKDKLFHELMKSYVGFGKIDALMNDPYIEDISCNGPNEFIYINHRIYSSIPTNIKFNDEVELNTFVLKVVQSTGRHISILQPIRDATLPDGSRINVTLGKEVTKKGSTFTIRRFKSNPISPVELIKYGTFDSMQLAFLWILIENKRSLLAVGGTASGKTTTLNALCSFIRPEHKVVSIEDTAELNLLHPNWTQSVTRFGFGEEGEGKRTSSTGNIELYDLLKAALRQRPEYIIVGEVRGVEAYTLFQAISLGHPCFGTIHAGSMKELLSRVESKPMNVSRSLFSNMDIVIFNSLLKIGEHHVRRAVDIIEIEEVDPIHKNLITHSVYNWKPITDTFEFAGRSIVFEKIAKEYGIPIEYLMSEMHSRAKLLDDLAQKNITNYNSVVDIIRKYMRDKDTMIEEAGGYEIRTT